MNTTGEDLISRRIRGLRENTDFLSTLLRTAVSYAMIVADFSGSIIAYSEGAQRRRGGMALRRIGSDQ